MAVRSGSRSPENSERRAEWRRRKARIRGATFLPWNLFPSASARRSCLICRSSTFLQRQVRIAVLAVRFFENCDEHWRNVLQKILGRGVLEDFRVLLQLVGDLVDNEATAGRERIVRFLKKLALLVELKNAERNARDNVIARGDSPTPQFQRKMGRIVVDNLNTRITIELAAQIA